MDVTSIQPSTNQTAPLTAQLLQAAVAQSFNAVMITSADLSGSGPLIEYCNEALCKITGYAEAELLGHSPRMLQGPLTDRSVLQHLRSCLEEGRCFQGLAINYRKSGETYWLEWNVSPVFGEAGQISHFVSVQQDVTARVQAEQERQLLAQALNASNDAVLITDRQFVIVFVNRAFEQMSGYVEAEILGKTPMLLLRPGAHAPAFYVQMQSALDKGEDYRATFTNRHKSGALYYAEQSIAALRDAQGQVSHYVGISKDITAMVQRENALQEQATHDQLTGVLNRHAGEAALRHCQAQAQENALGYGLILGDVDHFKQVNDRCGHPAGDRVLKLVANVLSAQVRESDSVVRWGGEEFLLVLSGIGRDDLLELAERIRSAIAACSDPEVGNFTMSLGAVLWQTADTVESLLQRSDEALYCAKERGRNQVVLADGEKLVLPSLTPTN